MKKVYLLVVCMLLVFTAAAIAQEPATKPSYQHGEIWQYRITEKDFVASSSEALNGNYEVAFTGGKFSAFYLNGNSKEAVNTNPDEPGEALAFYSAPANAARAEVSNAGRPEMDL